MAVRTGQAAINWAKSPLPRRGLGGLCLKFTRQAFNVGSKYGYARLAWQRSKKKHKTSSTAQIPVGVPIYMDRPGSKYGHVALYAGNGRMYTTRSSTNQTHLDSVALWKSWGWRQLGWTEDINGVTVYRPKSGSGSGSSSSGSTAKPGKHARYRVTAKAGVNVRDKATTKSKVVNRLAKGNTFTVPRGSGTVVGDGRRWFRTTSGNFVAADFVKKVN